MDDICLEITIPEKVSLNKVYAGIHWRKRQELAQLYHEELLEIKGKIKVSQYPVHITYDFHFTGNALDTLNCALMAKMLEDGLVGIKAMEDDSPDYVRTSTIHSQKSTQYKHDTVIVTICSLK